MKKYSLILLLLFPLSVMFNVVVAQNNQAFTDIVVDSVTEECCSAKFKFSRLYTGDDTRILDAGMCVSQDASTYGKKYENPSVRKYGQVEVLVKAFRPNTTYYVRAYIQTERGISYSSPVKFKTGAVTVKNYEYPQGAVRGYFSVSPTKKVCFSKGSLQYNAVVGTHLDTLGERKKGTWRFAIHQYDAMGKYNLNASSTYNGWIDKFAWGASGFNNINPWDTSNIAGTFYDWGMNAISNGGDKPGIWRTLSMDEWDYLFYEREYACCKKGYGKVNDVIGVVLLPDDWILPSDVPMVPMGDALFIEYTAIEWGKMEANGAVFLRFTLWENDDSTTESTTITDSKGNSKGGIVEFPLFSLSGPHAVGYWTPKSNKYAVRLVHDLE